MRLGPTVVLFCTTAVCLFGARPAAAQADPPTSVFGGYAYLREQGPGGLGTSTYTRGWMVTVAQRIGGRLGGVGEIGISSRSNVFDETQQLLGFFGGVRYAITRSPRLTTFVQALAGVERFSEPGFSESGLAFQPGAGVELPVWSDMMLRLQGDYRMSRQQGGTFKDLRFVVAVGARFGG